MKKTILTLTLITQNHKILLGYKKRGFGMGRYNGFGGKLEKDESIEEAAIREVFEESSLELKNIEKRGVIDFNWQNKDDHLEVHIFHSQNFVGVAQESEEMLPEWFEISKIPYKKMWDDDKYWLPIFLDHKKFKANFLFDRKDKVVSHKIELI